MTDRDDRPWAEKTAKAVDAANARVRARLEFEKLKAERKSPPRPAPAKDNRHEPR
jgi:hypothetical protein